MQIETAQFTPLLFPYTREEKIILPDECVDSDDEPLVTTEATVDDTTEAKTNISANTIKQNSLENMYLKEFIEDFVKKANLTPREIREIVHRPIGSYLKFTAKQLERRKNINKKLELVAQKINKLDHRLVEAEEKYPSGELYCNTDNTLCVIQSFQIDVESQKIYAKLFPVGQVDPAKLELVNRDELRPVNFSHGLFSQNVAKKFFDPLGRWC